MHLLVPNRSKLVPNRNKPRAATISHMAGELFAMMTGIALASAINTAAMPAMGRTLRDTRSPFGGLSEGRSVIFHLR